MSSKVYDIVAGPSKFDLMASLFMGDFRDRKPVVFHVMQNGRSVPPFVVHINGVDREDGSGESWCFGNSWGCLFTKSYPCLNSITSPSRTTYSFPSVRSFPCSRALGYPPVSNKSSQKTTSAFTNLS